MGIIRTTLGKNEPGPCPAQLANMQDNPSILVKHFDGLLSKHKKMLPVYAAFY